MNARNACSLAALACLAAAMGGCGPLGISLFYTKAELPDSRVVSNVRYFDGAGSDAVLNRLDLFLPSPAEAPGWPTLVFVHGGNWSEGDKDLKVAGADVYRNIGRYFASHGIGAAIISYRLLPGVDWRVQALDVARATAWVHGHVRPYHGDPDAIFLAGHSAGAQIASRVALDPSLLDSLGLSTRSLCGVIAVSGIGYDFLDPETYQFGKDQGAIREVFQVEDLSMRKRKELSPILLVKETSVPFLILDAEADPKEIRHASRGLHEALAGVGARTQRYTVPRVGHQTMVLAMSHADRMPAAMMMTFMRTSTCGGSKR